MPGFEALGGKGVGSVFSSFLFFFLFCLNIRVKIDSLSLDIAVEAIDGMWNSFPFPLLVFDIRYYLGGDRELDALGQSICTVS